MRNAGGAAIRDANVLVFSTQRADWLMPHGLRYHTIRSNAEGAFTLPSIPAGSYLAAWWCPRKIGIAGQILSNLESLRLVATPFPAANGSTATVSLVVKR